MMVGITLALLMQAATTPAPIRIPPPIVYSAPLPPVDGDRSRPVRPRGYPGSWITADDYPPEAIRKGAEGTSNVRLTIGVTGRVGACAVLQSSGWPLLDIATCRNMLRRARFFPALSLGGNPTVGDYIRRVRWRLPPEKPNAPVGNDANVNSNPSSANASIIQFNEEITLPPRATNDLSILLDDQATENGPNIYFIMIGLNIDESGNISSCDVVGYIAPDSPEGLGRRTCSLFSERARFSPAIRNGVNVPGTIYSSWTWRLAAPIEAAPAPAPETLPEGVT